jgi:hypothetical protein
VWDDAGSVSKEEDAYFCDERSVNPPRTPAAAQTAPIPDQAAASLVLQRRMVAKASIKEKAGESCEFSNRASLSTPHCKALEIDRSIRPPNQFSAS